MNVSGEAVRGLARIGGVELTGRSPAHASRQLSMAMVPDVHVHPTNFVLQIDGMFRSLLSGYSFMAPAFIK